MDGKSIMRVDLRQFALISVRHIARVQDSHFKEEPKEKPRRATRAKTKRKKTESRPE